MTYEKIIRKISRDRNKADILDFLFAGGFAGISYWITAYPLDTIKTKVQANRDMY
jgi:hypothetical protein